MLQSGMLFADRFVWFTPSWLVGVGVTLGLAALFALLGVLWLIKRPAARWCWEVATEGGVAAAVAAWWIDQSFFGRHLVGRLVY